MGKYQLNHISILHNEFILYVYTVHWKAFCIFYQILIAATEYWFWIPGNNTTLSSYHTVEHQT